MFVNSDLNYQNVDSIYNEETKSNIIKWIDKFSIYPISARKNCISENIRIGFKVNDIYGKAILDTLSIKIKKGSNSDLVAASIKMIKKMQQWVHPNHKLSWSYPQNVDISFVISFSYKMTDCNESPFRIETSMQNGQYSEYYKINNRKKVEGFFKNGFADSVWIFYDTSGLVIQKGHFKECSNRRNGRKKHLKGEIIGEINGTKNGKWEYYNSLGQLMLTQQFDCNKIVLSTEFIPGKNE